MAKFLNSRWPIVDRLSERNSFWAPGWYPHFEVRVSSIQMTGGVSARDWRQGGAVLSTADYKEPKKRRAESRAVGDLASHRARTGLGIPSGAVAIAITVFCAVVWCVAIGLAMRAFQLI